MTQKLGHWKQANRRVILVLCALFAVMLPCTVQGGVVPSALPVDLEIRAYHLKFTPDGQYLLLVEGLTDRVVLYNVGTRSIKFSAQVTHNVLDTTFSSRGNYIYLLGQGSKTGHTAISRIFLPDGSVRTVEFDRELDRPSMAVGRGDRLFVAWHSAKTLKQVPASLFDTSVEGAPNTFNVGEGGDEVPIEAAPIAGIESVPGNRTMFISHASERAVTAIDIDTRRPIDYLRLGLRPVDENAPPLDLVATSRQEDLSADPNSIIIGDAIGPRLLIADVDEAFSSFDIIQVVTLKLPDASDTILHGKSRLLVAANTEQDVILVGSEASTEVFVYSRSIRSLEVQNTLKLPFRPSALGVSPKGDIAAFVDASSGRLVLQAHPAQRAGLESANSETERVREVQRRLAELGYPVGLVDGLHGTQTRVAIAHFQQQQGLQVTGAVDEELLTALREEVEIESGRRTEPGVDKEFVVVQAVINPVVQPRKYSDAIRFCAEDEGCRSLSDAAASVLGLPSGMIASALADVPQVVRVGEEGRYTIALPPGYEYCRSRTRTRSVVPATGDRASVLGARSTKDGIGVYTWTPRSGEFGARSWVEAEFTVYGVRQDVADLYRNTGICRRHGQTLISCRGATGVNKGTPACGTVMD